MALQSYILSVTSRGANARYAVSYRSGKFFRLEQKSGKLIDEKQWQSLMQIVPELEINIKTVMDQYQKRGVEYQLIEKTNKLSLFSSFNSVYFDFYREKTGIDYDYRAVDGKATKMIIQSLQKICVDDADCLTTWQVILSNWTKLEEFYAKQIELKQINSNLNTILRQLKDGKARNKSITKGGESLADALRRRSGM